MKYFLTPKIGLRFIGLILVLAVTLNPHSNKPTQTASSASQTASNIGQTNPAQAASLIETVSGDGPPRYIAHAAGRYQGKVYTNSVRALQASHEAGYRLQEVDLNLTTDQRIVLLHDWDRTLTNVYGLAPGRRDYASFVSQAARNGFPATDLEAFAAWVSAHPTARIILDTKADTLGMLTRIATRYPHLRQQFIPYIYNIGQYRPVSMLGYENISLLYYGGHTPDALVAFARSHRLHSIAMQPSTFALQNPSLTQYARVYCWTINDPNVARELKKQDVYGVITDQLLGDEPAIAGSL